MPDIRELRIGQKFYDIHDENHVIHHVKTLNDNNIVTDENNKEYSCDNIEVNKRKGYVEINGIQGDISVCIQVEKGTLIASLERFGTDECSICAAIDFLPNGKHFPVTLADVSENPSDDKHLDLYVWRKPQKIRLSPEVTPIKYKKLRKAAKRFEKE